MARSQQPLVPERMLMMGGTEGTGAPLAGLSLFGRLLSLLLAEKAGLDLDGSGLSGQHLHELERFVEGFAASSGAVPAGAGDAAASQAAAAGETSAK